MYCNSLALSSEKTLDKVSNLYYDYIYFLIFI